MGLILDLSPRVLERVLYFASYIVLDPGETKLAYKQILNESEYQEACDTYGRSAFRVGMGAESIHELLAAIDSREGFRQALRLSLRMLQARSVHVSSRDLRL